MHGCSDFSLNKRTKEFYLQGGYACIALFCHVKQVGLVKDGCIDGIHSLHGKLIKERNSEVGTALLLCLNIIGKIKSCCIVYL